MARRGLPFLYSFSVTPTVWLCQVAGTNKQPSPQQYPVGRVTAAVFIVRLSLRHTPSREDGGRGQGQVDKGVNQGSAGALVCMRVCEGLSMPLSHWLWLPVGPVPLMPISEYRSTGWWEVQNRPAEYFLASMS